jgi:uncharacterized protein (DUF1499 family)
MTLEPCPNSPNCVSTQAPAGDTVHYVEPIAYAGPREALRDYLVEWIDSQPRARVTSNSPDTITAEFRSRIFRFVDDVVIVLPVETSIMHLRSASRVGYGDIGVNRQRYERIRDAVNEWQLERDE